jgi:hypothetical protein
MCHVITEDISLTTYSSHGLIVIIYGMIVIWLLSYCVRNGSKIKKEKKNFKPGGAEELGLVAGGSTQVILLCALWNGYNSNLTPQLGYNIVPPDFPLQQLVGTPAMASLRHQLQFSADRYGRHQA